MYRCMKRLVNRSLFLCYFFERPLCAAFHCGATSLNETDRQCSAVHTAAFYEEGHAMISTTTLRWIRVNIMSLYMITLAVFGESENHLRRNFMHCKIRSVNLFASK